MSLYAKWYASQSRQDVSRVTPPHEQWRRQDRWQDQERHAWPLAAPSPMSRDPKDPIRFFNNGIELTKPDDVRDRRSGAGLRTRRHHHPMFSPKFEVPARRQQPPPITRCQINFRQRKLDRSSEDAKFFALLAERLHRERESQKQQILRETQECLRLQNTPPKPQEQGRQIRGDPSEVMKALAELRF